MPANKPNSKSLKTTTRAKALIDPNHLETRNSATRAEDATGKAANGYDPRKI
jgi:hypothetical protein